MESGHNGRFLQENVLLEETGGDFTPYRGLYEEQNQSPATGTVFMIMNDTPLFTPRLEIKARLIIITYRNIYVDPDNVLLNNLSIYNNAKITRSMDKADLTLGKKRDIIAQGYLWLLVQTHKNINFKTGLKIPVIILNGIKQYWNAVDPYTRFCKDFIIETNKEESTLNLIIAYQVFEQWKRLRFRTIGNISITDFQIYMKSILNPNDTGFSTKYRGYKIRDKDIQVFIDNSVVINSDGCISMSDLYQYYDLWTKRINLYKYTYDVFKELVVSELGMPGASKTSKLEQNINEIIYEGYSML